MVTGPTLCLVSFSQQRSDRHDTNSEHLSQDLPRNTKSYQPNSAERSTFSDGSVYDQASPLNEWRSEHSLGLTATHAYPFLMASTDEEIEQRLASKSATPIAQLNPDLADPTSRKVHGEVTVTWPYSALTKRFAFLLAEPDFRLRRDKGLVRIQFNGPSAEAVGKWELGSGDEVTVALEGVEWAKDDEPARPPNSRLEWQLKYAGKLVLKVRRVSLPFADPCVLIVIIGDSR